MKALSQCVWIALCSMVFAGMPVMSGRAADAAPAAAKPAVPVAPALKPAAKAAAAPAAPAVPAAPVAAAAADSKGGASPAAASGPVNPKLDLVLKKSLDELKYVYDVNPVGACRIRLSLGGERSHQVFITSKRDSFVGVDFRRVYATAMKTKELPSSDIMVKLLTDNGEKKLGAWELVKWSDGYRLMLSARVPADCTPTVLKAAIRLVLFGADEMEEKLTAKDEF